MYSNNNVLEIVSRNGYIDIIKCLIKYGADIHVRSDYPLRCASGYGYLDVVEYLISWS
jgi:ankyrin repeat protein